MKDVFIVNMNNKDEQQKLCTEPKSTIADTIQFAISYEEGALRQQSLEKMDKPNIKPEPNEINNITSGTKRWGPTKKCFRCEAPFSPQHLKECRAMGKTCMKCGKKGHFAKCCQTRGAGNFAKSRKIIKAPAQSIQRIDEWEDSSSGSMIEEDKIVITIEEGESINASELWNTWFTMNHVNNLNDVLADEINQPIRRRRWLKLPRNDKRSKSAQLPVKNKQTAAYSNKTLTNKMGQTQSAEKLSGIENSQISNRLKPKMKLANQI